MNEDRILQSMPNVAMALHVLCEFSQHDSLWQPYLSTSLNISDCIVLYLYIYIALLAVHTNQKRFQCKRPREKRAVLRE